VDYLKPKIWIPRIDCAPAIGDRQASRQPTWGGFYNEKDALKCFAMVQHMIFTERMAREKQRAREIKIYNMRNRTKIQIYNHLPTL
jgi:hypothetical protein